MHTTSRRSLLRSALLAGTAALMPPAGRGQTATGPGREEPGGPAAQLWAAVIDGDAETVLHLLREHPRLVSERDGRGRSLFAVAELAGHDATAAVVRGAGYAPDVVECALALDWERFDQLAGGRPERVDVPHPIGGNAMVAAALGGAGRSAWRVLRQGGSANLAMEEGLGMTAVRAAFEHPDLAVAELTAATLLGNGGDANAPQRGGDSALHGAARRGSVALVEMLIRVGAAVGALDGRGRTAREVAEQSGHRDVVRVLQLHHEIPRDHTTSRLAWDVDGRPYEPPDLGAHAHAVIEDAVGRAHFDLEGMRSLVREHPELACARATSTELAVEACAHTGRMEIVELLLGLGAPCSLPTALVRGDLVRARELLDEDPLRVTERGPHDFALLWYPSIGASSTGSARALEATELLLDAGALIERQDHLGTTALHWAAAVGERDLAALLLERGADLQRVGRMMDPVGQTPLAVARARGREEMATFLRQRGGRP